MMKSVMSVFVMFAGLSAVAAPAKLMCVTAGSVDAIQKIVVTEQAGGQLNAVSTSVTVSNAGTIQSEKAFNSQGSIDSEKIQLSFEDKGPYGRDFVYLEKTGTGYAVVKYNQCNNYYQEETCWEERTEEVARETKVACSKL